MVMMIIYYSKPTTWTVMHGSFIDQISIDLLLLGVQGVQTVLPSIIVIVVIVVVVVGSTSYI